MSAIISDLESEILFRGSEDGEGEKVRNGKRGVRIKTYRLETFSQLKINLFSFDLCRHTIPAIMLKHPTMKSSQAETWGKRSQ